MFGYRSLKGLVALITGGASGLGKGTAEHLVKNGARVVICDLETSDGYEVEKNIKNEIGDDIAFVPTDVASEKDVQNALNVIKSRYGKLDVSINCAGISCAFKIYNFLKDRPHKLSEINSVLKTNVIGTFNVARLAAKLIAENEPDKYGQRGVIINTSGSSAFDGMLGQTVYSTSCHSIVSMTLPIAQDLDSHGIRCCTIAPGFFKTALLSMLPDDLIQFIGDSAPSPKRFGDPLEFAYMVQTIIENPALNGSTLRLDGGCRLQL